ncbi:HU family DNA-binding protein [Pseudooceanicola algae]|uniref:Uncharacterized protein n=1 Tax=Pseudooceanicola algae TaxID=1537215 RepID=A0A418SEZ8_9RHOB|nr:HU family DNA-binding protein [Pseudooceanicola algae]QPM89349.1 hypothetical protein PSAL_005640 [Pseudooceanicola algae]
MTETDKFETGMNIDTTPSSEDLEASEVLAASLPVELKKKELIDLVVARTGVKKRDAKPVVEAMLMVMGEALLEQRSMNLPPFGKVKINNFKEVENGHVFGLRLRQNEQVLNTAIAESAAVALPAGADLPDGASQESQTDGE